MSVPHAAGALIGTVEDLAKWNQALHGGKVIPAPLYQRMIAPTRMPDGKVENYGFGIGPGKMRGRDALGHSGGIFGFATQSLYIPKDDVFVAVFANSDSAAANLGTVIQRLAALAVGDPYPTFARTDFNLAQLEPWFGVYKVGESERIFFARDGKLYTRRSGGGEFEVFAAGQDRFFYGPDNLTWFEIRRGVNGKPMMAMYADEASEAELSPRSGPVPPEPKAFEVPKATLQSYVGNYDAKMAPIKVAFNEAGQLALKLGGQPFVPLRAISATEFAAIGPDAKVVFHVVGGKVGRLVIHQNGRELPADRVAD
jgi:hypothetical protein